MLKNRHEIGCKDIFKGNVADVDVVVIGAGITGLSAAFNFRRRNKNVLILEQASRVGGQIQTYSKGDYIFESGPNTSIVSHPEVAELFHALGSACSIENARHEAERRLIWKGEKFHALPSGLFSAIATPLFTFHDKFRILGEPFRAKGNNPDETVGELAARRLGQSYVDYAVDPFLSGVYAGDPMKLVTRYALPKLYNLEQNYGSFIRGSFAKARMKKTEHERLATKKVFSVKGGFKNLVNALADGVGKDRIILDAHNVQVNPMISEANKNIDLQDDNKNVIGFQLTYNTSEGEFLVNAKKVVTTTGAYALPSILPFVETELMRKISSLEYAPIIQASVGVKVADVRKYCAFGGLIPSCEHKDVLGILFPSAFLENRAPERGMLFSFFMGGVKHKEMLEMSEEELRKIILENFHSMLGFPRECMPELIEIFKHPRAIPQYYADTGARLEAVEKIEKSYPGLIIAGNLKDGIGMADRICQGCRIGSTE